MALISHESTESENLWNKILSEASRSVSDRLDSKTLLVLGDKNSGKSTLITRIQGLDIADMRKGVGLDYSFLDIHPENDDDTVARLNVWQLEGEPEHKDLLKFALNPTTIGNSVVMIALDFTQPWNLIETLNKWLGILQKHISSVSIQLPPGGHQELKNSLIYDFQNYQDPSGSGTVKTIQKKKRPIDEQSLLPLKDGVLTNNFGIPILIVCCKTDNFIQLEKEYNYKDSHFDYIQQYLRRVGLTYGASLIYTSAKKDKNCDVLLQYIKHLLYGFEFNEKIQLTEKDTIFIPIGADSITKINVDFENQTLTKDVDEPFEDIIKLPKRLQQTATTSEPIITAEEDQEFFNKYREVLEKEKANEAKKGPAKDGLLQSLKSMGTTMEATSSSSPTVATKPILNTTPQEKQSLPQIASLTGNMSDNKTGANEHQVLSDFFNSLINNKDATSRGGVASSIKKSTTADLNLNNLRSTTSSQSKPTNADFQKQLEQIKNGKSTKQ